MERLRRILLQPDVQALLLLAALTVVFLLPGATLQGVYLYGDAGDSFTRLAYGTERLRAGQLPLWDPYLSLGGTHAGDPLALTWYPPTLVLFLLLPEQIAYNYTFVLHLFLAAAGMYLLARRWGLERAGALVAALVFGFSGFSVAHLQHLNILVALTWLPWIFLCVENFFVTRRFMFVGLGALVLGLQLLGGQTQMVVYGAFAWLGYCTVWLVREWRGGERVAIWKRAAALLAMIIGGIGIAAIFLVPYVELVLFIGRSDRIAYDYVTRFSLEGQRLIAFVYPFFFGGNAGSVERGAGSLIEMSAYVGILPLALSVVALARREWRVYFLWGVALVALVLAFGKYSPLFNLVYYVPVLGKLESPARFLGLVVFALALLAGIGLEQIKTRVPTRLLYAVLAVLAFVLLGLGILVVLPRVGVQLPLLWAEAARNRALLVSVTFAGAALVVIALWARKVVPQRALVAVTLILVFVELFYFGANFQYNFVGQYNLYTTPGKSARVILRDRNRYNTFYWGAKEPSLMSFMQRGDLPGFAGMMRGGIRQSVPLKLKIHSMQGYRNEPIDYARQLADLENNKNFDADEWRELRKLGTEGLLTTTKLNVPNLQLVERNGGISLFRLVGAQGRVYMTFPNVAPAKTKEPFQGQAGLFPVEDVTGDVSVRLGSVRIVQDEPERVVLDVQAESDALVVLNDTFFPGWVVLVDGNPTPLLRANGVTRATAVNPGTHRVEFVYDPLAFKIGAGVTLAALALVVGGTVWSARRRNLELRGERRTTKVVITK